MNFEPVNDYLYLNQAVSKVYTIRVLRQGRFKFATYNWKKYQCVVKITLKGRERFIVRHRDIHSARPKTVIFPNLYVPAERDLSTGSNYNPRNTQCMDACPAVFYRDGYNFRLP